MYKVQEESDDFEEEDVPVRAQHQEGKDADTIAVDEVTPLRLVDGSLNLTGITNEQAHEMLEGVRAIKDTSPSFRIPYYRRPSSHLFPPTSTKSTFPECCVHRLHIMSIIVGGK